jgi:hypothetical protein
MIVANYILLALGILGGVDILLYHSVSHGIRSHAESRWELVTHAMRGPTYATLFLVTPNFETRGAWAVAIALLLVFDVGISIADFALERRSRAKLGGLPGGEYVLHMMMAILFGAFVAFLAPNLRNWMTRQTDILARDDLGPAGLRIVLAGFAVCVLFSGALDLVAAARCFRKTSNAKACG